MQRAAAGLAVACARLLRDAAGGVAGRRVVVLAGSGNNGGDGLLTGELLRRRGVQVTAVLLASAAYTPGVDAVRRAGGRLVDASTPEGLDAARQALTDADLVVDAVVGIGGTTGLRAPADEVVAAIPAGAPVLAVDLPSGVDPESGEAPGAYVRADVTVALGAPAPGLLLPPGCYAAGQISVVDVGVRGHLEGEPVVRRLSGAEVAARWPVPARTAHKYLRGVLGVVAGSDPYPGAAVLACAGAVRAGAGIVRYLGPAGVTDHVLRARPECVPGDGRVQAWLLGSGVEDDAGQDAAIARALESGLPCVVDAGALSACVRRRAAGDRPAPAGQVLLTPHAGELARMLELLGHAVSREQVEARAWHHARWLAREADATVLLKGSTTLVVGPDGEAYSQDDGPAWMAAAGSGDVLAGIAGALMSAGLAAAPAGAVAASVHGRAGARAAAGGPLAASDIADATPRVVAELLAARAAAPNGVRSRRGERARRGVRLR
ncbi:bifunctional ADP-dependent NAD(P)H-hydrate dehydratase/NAD(P)H-hydrate epimerase [Krasilnikovia sp. MM14-A1259]